MIINHNLKNLKFNEALLNALLGNAISGTLSLLPVNMKLLA